MDTSLSLSFSSGEDLIRGWMIAVVWCRSSKLPNFSLYSSLSPAPCLAMKVRGRCAFAAPPTTKIAPLSFRALHKRHTIGTISRKGEYYTHKARSPPLSFIHLRLTYS